MILVHITKIYNVPTYLNSSINVLLMTRIHCRLSQKHHLRFLR